MGLQENMLGLLMHFWSVFFYFLFSPLRNLKWVGCDIRVVQELIKKTKMALPDITVNLSKICLRWEPKLQQRLLAATRHAGMIGCEEVHSQPQRNFSSLHFTFSPSSVVANLRSYRWKTWREIPFRSCFC